MSDVTGGVTMILIIVIFVFVLTPNYKWRFKYNRIGCSKLGVDSGGKHTCSYLSTGTAKAVGHCNRKECPILKGEA